MAEKEQAKLIIVTSLVQSYLNYEKSLNILNLKRDSLLVRSRLLELTQLSVENGLDNLIDSQSSLTDGVGTVPNLISNADSFVWYTLLFVLLIIGYELYQHLRIIWRLQNSKL